MHIIIAVLTAAGGLIWALFRLQNSGVDLNAFNPFHWARRRRWEREVGVKPLYRLEKPMEVAAVLVVAAVLSDGELTREAKGETIQLFEQEFSLDHDVASELFSSAAFLLKDCIDYTQEVTPILAKTKPLFSPEQAESTIDLIRKASTSGGVTELQGKLIASVSKELEIVDDPQGKWT